MVTIAKNTLRRLALDQFESELCSTCGNFGVVAAAGRKYIDGLLRTDSKAGLEIASVGQNTNVIVRSNKHIRTDPGSHYFLIIQDQGRSQIAQGDCSEKMQVGDFFIVDSTKPCRFDYGGVSNLQISLHLPRDEMVHRFGQSIHGGIYIAGKDPLCQAMRAIITDLLASERLGQAHVLEAFYSVLGASLLNRSLGKDSKIKQNHTIVNQALDVMARHFRDPEFTPKHAAGLIGVSQRQMQRVFKERKIGPQQTLQSLRIDAASELIANEQGELSGSISSIAFQCGFSDLSTFYRQFKNRHGCSPGECLKHRRDMQ